MPASGKCFMPKERTPRGSMTNHYYSKCMVGQKHKENMNAMAKAGHQSPREVTFVPTLLHMFKKHMRCWGQWLKSMLHHSLQPSSTWQSFQSSPHCCCPTPSKGKQADCCTQNWSRSAYLPIIPCERKHRDSSSGNAVQVGALLHSQGKSS